MEPSQWDIYVKLAIIVGVPISIIGIYITYVVGKAKLKNSETKIGEIGDSIKQGDISVEAKKYPDNTIEIKLTGSFDKTHGSQRPTSPYAERILHVVMTCKDDKIELYLNGKPEDNKIAEEAE